MMMKYYYNEVNDIVESFKRKYRKLDELDQHDELIGSGIKMTIERADIILDELEYEVAISNNSEIHQKASKLIDYIHQYILSLEFLRINSMSIDEFNNEIKEALKHD